MILIVGAGLAGLSTAYHLADKDYQLYERDKTVGGLCRSYDRDGFTFDYTGHLLHLRNEYTGKLLEKLLPDKLASHHRRASIYSQKVFTPYPFQGNLYQLPKEIIKECLIGFIEARLEDGQKRGNKPVRNGNSNISFKDWIIATFGKGIARYFMLPYNEKLWLRDLDTMSLEWVDWSIPVPSLDEVVGGALGMENHQMGYSARFLYPEKGGIGILPRAFLPYIREVFLNRSLTAIDLHEKKAWFDDGNVVRYDRLVSTIPLPELINVIRNVPSHIADLSKRLQYISVFDINLGISGNTSFDQHWVYFPEPENPFYRAGF